MKTKVLLIDNYDSFTYNLYDYLLQLGVDCWVIRNDQVSLEEIERWNPDAMVLSPGPKRPIDAGRLMELLELYHQKLPILGICLGHQAIGEFFGAKLEKASIPMHGKNSLIQHLNKGVFEGLTNPMQVMRYHSLILNDWPEEILEALAFTEKGELMAFQHRSLPLIGLQFHPESVLTPEGLYLIRNWLESLKK